MELPDEVANALEMIATFFALFFLGVPVFNWWKGVKQSWIAAVVIGCVAAGTWAALAVRHERRHQRFHQLRQVIPPSPDGCPAIGDPRLQPIASELGLTVDHRFHRIVWRGLGSGRLYGRSDHYDCKTGEFFPL